MSDEKMKENPLGDESEEKVPVSTLRMWAIGGQITRSSSNEELLGAKVLGAVHDKQKVNNLHHDQFRERIELWRRLSYPHLLTLYGTTPDVFVLEHAQAFRTYVTEGGNYTRVFRVLYEVLLAMLYLHERGFAHGAVDLDHIVIGDDQKAKLVMDFKSICGYEPEADPPTTGQRSVFRDDELQFLKCVEEAIKYANTKRLATAHGVNAGCEVQTASEHADVKKVYCDKLTPMEQLTADWDPDVHKKACQFIGNLYKRSDEQETPMQLFSRLDKKFKDLAGDESEGVHQRKNRERAKH
uniref:Protein kinase domain-containing protein n=1 Tax=Globisporangium ultimum (strain ATCC 200006 / CBS 805.95 / DAOM BR144) TaxID=431595 RepID=K3X5H7_GLOUD